MSLSLWLVICLGGDRWWPATFLLFAPRWLAALPLAVLLPLAVWRNRLALFPLLAGGAVVLGPFMGLQFNPGASGHPGGRTLRVLTCNVEGGSFDAKVLAALIDGTGADIVALQECPREIDLKLALPPKWQVSQSGQLAVISKYPLESPKTVQAMHPPHKWPRTCLLQCVVRAPGGDLVFNSIHLPSPRYGLQTLLDRHTLVAPSRKGLLVQETAQRRQTAREVQRIVASSTLPTIVAGDFNMPVDSSIYRAVWGGYQNAFSAAGCGYGWTQRSSVRGLPIPVRIDHVLVGGGLAARGCQTGAAVGSDHLPLLADITR